MTQPAPSPDPLAKLQTLTKSDLTESRGSVLYTGEYGEGKTACMLSWPKPIVVAYFDRNFDTARRIMAEFDESEVRLVFPSSWREWADVFVPAVANRQIEAATIGVDTFSFLTKNILWPDIQGQKPKLAVQDFGTGLARMEGTLDQLVSTTRPIKDPATGAVKHPGYHVVGTVHLSDVTNDDGVLLASKPAVMGAFKDSIGAFFDLVLLNRSEVRTRTEKIDGRNQSVSEKEFYVYTMSPDRYHFCKAPAYLPARMDGRYESLWPAWHPKANNERK